METKKSSKYLAIFLALVMVLALLPMSAMATTSATATFSFTGDANIDSAEIAGSGTGTLKILDTVGPELDQPNGHVKTCQVELSPNSTASAATVTLKNGNTTVDTLSVSLLTTVPTEVSVNSVSKSITVGDVTTTYVFVFVKEYSYTAGSSYNNCYIELPDPDVTLGTGSNGVYSSAETTIPGLPQLVSLRIVPAGDSYDDVSDVTVSIDNGTTTGVFITHQAGSYYVLNIPSATTIANFTVNYKKNNVAQDPVSFSITMTYRATVSDGSGIYAYLPAPGQFTNEGINTGGWGDAYESGSGALKDMVDNVVSTGVSLGYFGGYVVLDVGTVVTETNGVKVYSADPITNSAYNPFGVDFIVYGNAFKDNSEPGCIQVAQAVAVYDTTDTTKVIGYVPGDANEDGQVWYDIAGSLYYNSTTDTSASLTYTNPHPTDDDDDHAGWPQSGTVSSPNSSNNVPYTIDPNTTVNYVTYNTFHRHAWFPLWANYFASRTTGSGNNAVTIGPLDQATTLNADGTVQTTKLPFAKYYKNTSTGSKLTLTGVCLADPTLSGASKATLTSLYTFGYADVHPNGSSYGTATNPYAATADTTGGDGIDISWAVKADGTPANLSSVHFIRIYTGLAKMNGIFGEISTEVCGIYVATPNGSTVGTTVAPKEISMTFKNPQLPVDNNPIVLNPSIPSANGGTQAYISNIITEANNKNATTFAISITATVGANVYVNSTKLTQTSTKVIDNVTYGVFTGTIGVPTSTQDIRIITQSGTAAPYIFLYT